MNSYKLSSFLIHENYRVYGLVRYICTLFIKINFDVMKIYNCS